MGKNWVMRITVHAKPGSKKGPAVDVGDDGIVTVFLKERAVDGAANDGLIAVLADFYGVRKSAVSIASGHSSRHKIVDIDD